MSIEQQIEQIARTVVLQELAQQKTPERDEEAEQTRRRIERIKAKEFVSAPEAAILLGCSDQHLRNVTQSARDGSTKQAIPFCDLDGPITFPLKELLEWARLSKPKTRKKTKSTTPKTIDNQKKNQTGSRAAA